MGFKKLTAGLLLGAFMLTGQAPSAEEATQTPAPASTLAPPPAAASTALSAPVSALSADGKYAGRLYLAYIRGGESDINATAEKGVQALADVLAARTAVEPAGVASLDIEQDDITFFPFIYWPITANTPPLSEKAQKKVQHYIDTGGMILFDIDDNAVSIGDLKDLRRVLGHVSLKPLVPLTKDHVLTRTFFALTHLRGSFDYGDVKVESDNARDLESMSSVIVGENGWAGAWAATTLPIDSREREMALRAGINMVMYALTGNYKSDQALILKNLNKFDRN